MFKNKALSLLTLLLCVLFCATITHGQERLWGHNGYSLFSVNRDGTDLKLISAFNSERYGSLIYGFTKLVNGEIVLTTDFHGTDQSGYIYGRINKIGASGLDTLYTLGYNMVSGTWGMVTNDDGRVYLPSSSVGSKLSTIFVANPNGGSISQRNLYSQPLSNDYYLTKTPHGIFGLSRGNTGNRGVLFKVNLPGSGGYDIIYTFTGGADGDRPAGQLYEGTDSFLFGATSKGGLENKGIYFKIKSDGSSFTKLYDVATGQMNAKNGAGKFQRFVDLVAHGLIPQRDSDGIMYLNATDGIYKVANDGTPILRVTSLTSERFAFITPGFQHVVKVNNIPNGAFNRPRSLTLSVDLFKGAINYDFQISQSPDFSSGVQQYNETAGSINVTGLDANTTYYVRARPNIYPYYGEVTHFTTAPALDITQERLWGSNADPLSPFYAHVFSSKTDGSDFIKHTENGGGFFQTSNNEIILAYMDFEDEYYSSLFKITPGGLSNLYMINYMDPYFLGTSMAEHPNGKIYGISGGPFDVKVGAAHEIRPDGSFYQFKLLPSTADMSRDYYLTATDHGVYAASRGDSNNKGFIYRVNPTLSGVDPIYQFTGGIDGQRPFGKLVRGQDNFLFGRTLQGGLNNKGILFKVKDDGTGFTKLGDRASGDVHSQDGSGKFFRLLELIGAGYIPLTDRDGFYYLATPTGVFKIRPDGFPEVQINAIPNVTNLALVSPPFQHQARVSNIVENSSGHPTDLDLRSNPFTYAQWYEFQLSTTADFSSGVTSVSGSDSVNYISGLLPNTTYYARVRTEAWPYFGAVRTFSTAASMARIAQGDFDAYPNPSSSGFSITGGGEIRSIVITESNGNVIMKTSMPADVSWSFGERLARGLYYIKIESEGATKTIRWIKE